MFCSLNCLGALLFSALLPAVFLSSKPPISARLFLTIIIPVAGLVLTSPSVASRAGPTRGGPPEAAREPQGSALEGHSQGRPEETRGLAGSAAPRPESQRRRGERSRRPTEA